MLHAARKIEIQEKARMLSELSELAILGNPNYKTDDHHRRLREYYLKLQGRESQNNSGILKVSPHQGAQIMAEKLQLARKVNGWPSPAQR
jgi:hypothetical protein